MLDGMSLWVKSFCQGGGRGKLNYLPCRSCVSRDPIFCEMATRKTASCNSMSFEMPQKSDTVHLPTYELSTRIVRFIVPLSRGRLGMHQ